MGAQQEILAHIQVAVKALMQAHQAAIAVSPMAAAVPAIGQLAETAKRLGLLMQEISRIPGL